MPLYERKFELNNCCSTNSMNGVSRGDALTLMRDSGEAFSNYKFAQPIRRKPNNPPSTVRVRVHDSAPRLTLAGPNFALHTARVRRKGSKPLKRRVRIHDPAPTLTLAHTSNIDLGSTHLKSAWRSHFANGRKAPCQSYRPRPWSRPPLRRPSYFRRRNTGGPGRRWTLWPVTNGEETRGTRSIRYHSPSHNQDPRYPIPDPTDIRCANTGSQ